MIALCCSACGFSPTFQSATTAAAGLHSILATIATTLYSAGALRQGRYQQEDGQLGISAIWGSKGEVTSRTEGRIAEGSIKVDSVDTVDTIGIVGIVVFGVVLTEVVYMVVYVVVFVVVSFEYYQSHIYQGQCECYK